MKRLMLILLAMLVLTGCTGHGDTRPTQPPVGVEDELISGEDRLVCVDYSRYSGIFPEDDSGKQVKDAAAILVRNESDKFLDYALIQCDIGEDRVGTFQLTGLGAGESAWILERSGMTLTAQEHFKIRPCTEYAFRSDAVTETDLLSVQAEGYQVTVTNRSNQVLENVCLYYKLVHADGNYFGGRTYMLTFDTLSPGQSTRKPSTHFGETARIVRYSFQIQKEGTE